MDEGRFNRKSSTLLHVPYVEVRPVCRTGSEDSPELTSAFVKTSLIRATHTGALLDINAEKTLGIHIKWSRTGDQSSYDDANQTGAGKTVPTLSFEHSLVGFSLVSIRVGTETSNTVQDELLCFPTNDPSCTEPWPCECRGYVRSDELIPFAGLSDYRCAVLVTESTLVRVLPCQTDGKCSCNPLVTSWSDGLTGEYSLDAQTGTVDEVFASQNPTAIQELVLRMQRLLAAPVYIGTTADALQQRRQQHASRIRREQIRSAVALTRPKSATPQTSGVISSSDAEPQLCDGELLETSSRAETSRDRRDETKKETRKVAQSLSSTLLRDGALLVHSPDHGAGKTELVKAIAHCGLSRTVPVHVIRPEAMLARYGVHADAALQSVIHAVSMQAAVRQQPVCILLDGLEAMLPPTDRSSGGDAAVPVLHGMTSFLQTLAVSLLNKRELPFPHSNPLYNIHGHEYGVTLPVYIILVAVMTCPDKDWGHFSGTALTSAMGTYRLPNLSSATRLSAFQWALAKEGLAVSDDLKKRLPYLAASAVSTRGAEFRRLARRLRSRVERSQPPSSMSNGNISISVSDVESELALVGKFNRNPCNVQFSAESTVGALFGVVGGNEEAKVALYDALALDANRRKRIETLGLNPATGILLYGPPGTGKTLLAKAISKVLQSGGSRSSTDIGGAFISLSSYDIVQAEVGTSEKLVSAAFQTARANSPSVIFIDEFQALFTERSRGGSGRLSTALLQCMDDLNQWREAARKGDHGDVTNEVRVLVVAATNTPWMIDRSFLRSGRFDRSVHVGLPNASERKAILALYTGRMKMNLANDLCDMETFCERISRKIVGFSGADISALCRAAAMRCLVEQSESVREEHFDEVLDDGFTCSCSSSLVDRIRKWQP